jgi:hypothetical protein
MTMEECPSFSQTALIATFIKSSVGTECRKPYLGAIGLPLCLCSIPARSLIRFAYVGHVHGNADRVGEDQVADAVVVLTHFQDAFLLPSTIPAQAISHDF